MRSRFSAPPTCIDLFAGCGGLSLGLEEAGFKPLLFSELNESAAQTYLANREDQEIDFYSDVRKLTNEKLALLQEKWRTKHAPQVDLVCGGPPCQGYSGIGHRRSYEVTREEIPSNHLFKEMTRVIRAVRPRMFLFENVRGLLHGKWTPEGRKGEIWDDVFVAFRRLEKYGYSVRWNLVQAKDYGVPQNRPRVLIVGALKGSTSWTYRDAELAVDAGLLPEPTGNAPHLESVLGDLIDPNYGPESIATTRYPHPANGEFQQEMRARTGLESGCAVTEHEYSNHSPRIREKFRYMLEHGGEIHPDHKTKKFAQRVLDRTWDENGPNITATSLPDDFVHFAQARSLTVREWARIQTFPDHYKFRGPRTTGGTRRAGIPTEGVWDREVPKYTQIGNAVPVRLASAIGKHFVGLLR